MDSTGTDVLAEQFACLESMSPLVEAFGVGGSRATGSADAASDLDIFVLLSGDSVRAVFRDFPERLSHGETPLVRLGPEYLSGFGFRYRYLFERTGKIEYFVNTRESFVSCAAVARTRVVHDSAGWWSAQIQAARSAAFGWKAEARAHWIANAVDLNRYVLRRQPASASLVLARLQKLTCSVVLTSAHGGPFSLHGVQSEAERTVPAATLKLIFPDAGIPLSLASIVERYCGLRILLSEHCGEADGGVQEAYEATMHRRLCEALPLPCSQESEGRR